VVVPTYTTKEVPMPLYLYELSYTADLTPPRAAAGSGLIEFASSANPRDLPVQPRKTFV